LQVEEMRKLPPSLLFLPLLLSYLCHGFSAILSSTSISKSLRLAANVQGGAEISREESHSSKYILVTGGAGYIGSHTCIELLSVGEKVVVVDNLCNSDIEALNRARELTGVI